MRKLMLITSLVLLGTSSIAGEITVLSKETNFPNTSAFKGDCSVGNLSFIYAAYYDSWFSGPEKYAVPFNAADQGCVGLEGGAIKTIYMEVLLDETANLEVAAAILEAVDDGNGCLVPGVELVVSDTYIFNDLTGPSWEMLEIPIVGPCATSDDPLFLAVYFLNDNDGRFFGLPVTENPVACFNYNDKGDGYTDFISDNNMVGNIVLWADLDYCVPVVPNEGISLDSIKSLYR